MEKSRVLLVSEDTAQLQAWRKKFSEQDFDSAITVSPEEALRIMGREAFFLIIARNNLSAMPGTVLLEKAREQAPDTLRILATDGRDYQAALDAINRAEVFRILALPCGDEVLLEAVSDAWEEYREYQENETSLEKDDELKSQYRSLLQRISQQGFENRQLQEDLKKSHLASIELIAHALKFNSPGLWRQSVRTLNACKKILAILDIPAETQLQIEVAALMHTIGQIGLPQFIWRKPKNLLSEEEKQYLYDHPLRGFNIISTQPRFEEAADIILQHCEHYDGSGYPDGLAGDDILPGARILAATRNYMNTLDKLPFGHGGPEHPAFRFLEEGSGTLYDPDVVAIIRESILFHVNRHHEPQLTPGFDYQTDSSPSADSRQDVRHLSDMLPPELLPPIKSELPHEPVSEETIPSPKSQDQSRTLFARKPALMNYRKHARPKTFGTGRETSVQPRFLSAGMVLARDLVTEHGIMLLHKGSVVFPDQLPKIKRILENDPPANGNIYILRP